MIDVKDLSVQIGSKHILKDINITIKEGERVALVGANGAGKTSLVEVIIGLNKNYSGKINFNFKYDKSPLEKIGVQFQDALYPNGLSVGDVVEFFIEKTDTPDLELVEMMKRDFGISEFWDAKSSKISGGQAQKINILLALLNKPKVLFLDELTTGLDVHSKGELVNFIETYIKTKKITLILVTHTAGEIERFIDRVIVLSKGQVINKISTKDIKKKYKNIEEFLYSL